MNHRQQPGSLSTRLLVSQIGVSVAMALTMIVVAAIAGPPLFEAHMKEAGHDSPELLAHSQEAFSAAGALALGMGLAIAATGAVIVSVLITRRLRRSLTDLGDAAARISDGDYELRVEPADSRELATLAASFNTMAGKLATVEGSRRRLLTDLAHEIRTPLASMEICVESLEDGAIEPGPRAWQILSSQIDRISHLADDLGQVSAAEEGRLNLEPRPSDPNALAETAVLAARDGFERKQVELQLHPYRGDALWTEADPARIGQVLGNLLSNALRHTPSGGRVEITVTPDRDRVNLQVTDNGDGIAEEHLQRIFERFYRVDAARDREHGGTGVGLAISRAIARAHGGELSAASAGLGKGTTITLSLPIAKGSSEKLHTAP
ncbi:histidine kinase [Propionicimonas paludicola]|uniref:histidine kinase n=2 Tax=Propionicimonas paludicola TaxID=185243 RepID=A0A2A9CWJ5_9ACTN|nr:histidine kinase [Propionicimonas paludicola]